MSYLNYCQLFVKELGGIAGGSGPPQVTGQTGELGNVVTWIADADVAIQQLWQDWDFLWAQHSETTAAGSNIVGVPGGADPAVVGLVDRSSLVLRPGTTTAFKPCFVHWREFRDRWDSGDIKATKNPPFWTLAPDKTITLSHKLKEATDVRYDFWQKPKRMVQNDDVSLIPADSASSGVNYPRIILVRAKMIYAEREDAPEIMRGALAEYSDTLEKIESKYLPWMKQSRMASGDVPLAVEIP